MRSTRRIAPLGVVAGAAVALGASCAPTTHIVAEWKDPELTTGVVDRPLVVFMNKSEVLRRTVEDELAARIPGAVPAYKVLKDGEIFDTQKTQQEVRAAGFDTMIVTRLVDVNHEMQWTPGTPPAAYPGLWSLWGYGWPDVYEPGYLTSTTVVTLETLVYSLDPRFGSGKGELVWASRSQTFDPRTAKDLARSVVTASVKAMARQGLFVAQAEPLTPGRARRGSGARAR